MNRIVEIHIENLVLHGFSPHERHSIGDAVQTTLQQMFEEHSLPSMLSKGIFLHHFDAGTFKINSGQKSVTTGQSIADTLYNGFSNESRY